MAVTEGDYLRVSANFELGDGTQYQNIYHYTRFGTDPYSDAAHVNAVSTIMGLAYAELAGFTTTDVTEQLSYVDKVEWSISLQRWEVVSNVGTFTITFTPTQTGDALPYQCAPFVIFKTTRPQTVGRKFLFPFDEAWQADSHLEAGAVTALAAYGALVIDSRSLGGDAILFPGVPRTGVNQWLTFQTAVVSDTIGTQRRRRPGVGA